MMWINCLTVILPATFYTIHALHLPTPLNQSMESLSKLTSEWECVLIHLDIIPRYKDCIKAYNQLPNRLPYSSIRGSFHQIGEEDLYKLPVSRWHRTCLINVSLFRDNQQDVASWVEIVFMAEQLNDLCIQGTNTGGYLRMGENGRIKITLLGVNLQNGTAGGQIDVT